MSEARSAAFFAFPDRDELLGSGAPAVSVVAPVYNEAANVGALADEIGAALNGGEAFEMIFVDDASRDPTVEALKRARETWPQLRILRHGRNAGQSRALRTGALAARAPIVVTLDGDGQNDPADIPGLLEQLLREDAPCDLAMVAGERRARRDSAAKRMASRIANGVRRRLLDDGAADTGCGLKAFYREAFLRAPYFDHMHRYLPALFRREGFGVEFRPVNHRPRRAGVSKYSNLGRLAVAFRDLLGVIWLRDRARDPVAIEEE
ncbi:MAG: glycosyltransferase family 2 protein [Parvularculaceae bacterium]